MAIAAVHCFLIILSVVHLLVSSSLFVHQRKAFPVSGRDVLLVVTASTLAAATCILMVLQAHYDSPICGTLNIMFALVGIAAANFFVVRGSSIWFKYQIAKQRIEALALDGSYEKAISWYLSHRKWLRSRNLFAFATIVSLFDVLLMNLLSPFDWSNGHANAGESCVPVYAAIITRGVLGYCILGFVGFKLRNVQEGLWLKSELKWSAVTCLLTVFSGAPVYVDTSLSYPKYVVETMWTLFMQTVLIVWIDCPVILSFRGRYKGDLSSISDCLPTDYVNSKDSTREPHLKEILHEPRYSKSLESFKRHLIGEFNTESLLFYFATHELKTIQDQSAEATHCATFIARKALAIFVEFVGDGSPSQINISHRRSKAIHDEMNEAFSNLRQACDALKSAGDAESVTLELKRPVDIKAFESAQDAVVRLLERDPFVRWKSAMRKQNPSFSNSRVSVTLSRRAGQKSRKSSLTTSVIQKSKAHLQSPAAARTQRASISISKSIWNTEMASESMRDMEGAQNLQGVATIEISKIPSLPSRV